MSSQPNIEAEFSRIFHEFYAPLILFAYRITDNQSAAEDIVEDCFINLWKKQGSFVEIRSWKSFLYTSARNGCISWLRSEQRKQFHTKNIQENLSPDLSNTILENMIISETMTKMYAGIDKLPPKCRQIFIKHYLEGKTFSEISSELNISIKTARAHKYLGIKILQKGLLILLLYPFF